MQAPTALLSRLLSISVVLFALATRSSSAVDPVWTSMSTAPYTPVGTSVYMPETESLLMAREGFVQIWNTTTNINTRTYYVGGPEFLALGRLGGADSHVIAALTTTKEIITLDLSSGAVSTQDLCCWAESYDVAAAFSFDGARVAFLQSAWTKPPHFALVYDTRSGSRLLQVRSNDATMSALAFSVDGQQLAVAYAHRVEIWDIGTSHLSANITSLGNGTEAVSSVAFVAEGTGLLVSLVTNPQDGATYRSRIAVVDLASGSGGVRFLDSTSPSCNGLLLSTAPSPTSLSVAVLVTESLYDTNFFVCVLDIQSGATLVATDAGSMQMGDPRLYYNALQFAPDSSRIILSFHGGYIVLDASTGLALQRLSSPGYLYSLSFSPDNSVLASTCATRSVCLWDVATGLVRQRLSGHYEVVFAVAVSPTTGATVVSGGADDTVRVWDVRTGHELQTLIGHEGDVKAVAYSPDGRTILSGGEDGVLRLWAAESGNSLRNITVGSIIITLAVSPSAAVVVTGSTGGSICVWDIETGLLVHNMSASRSGDILALAFSNNGSVLVASDSLSQVNLWDMPSGLFVRNIAPSCCSWVYALAVLSDDRLVVPLSNPFGFAVFDLVAEEVTEKVAPIGNTRSITVSPDGHVAFGSVNDVLSVWVL